MVLPAAIVLVTPNGMNRLPGLCSTDSKDVLSHLRLQRVVEVWDPSPDFKCAHTCGVPFANGLGADVVNGNVGNIVIPNSMCHQATSCITNCVNKPGNPIHPLQPVSDPHVKGGSLLIVACNINAAENATYVVAPVTGQKYMLSIPLNFGPNTVALDHGTLITRQPQKSTATLASSLSQAIKPAAFTKYSSGGLVFRARCARWMCGHVTSHACVVLQLDSLVAQVWWARGQVGRLAVALTRQWRSHSLGWHRCGATF